MKELNKICNSIIHATEYKPTSMKQKRLKRKCMNIELAMFRLYLKTGKYSQNTFPFGELKIPAEQESEVIEIAKLLFELGWNPTRHVNYTRQKYKDINYIGQTLIC